VPLSVAAIAAGALAIGAMPSPLPEASTDPDARPAVLLRMEEVGGFAPFQASLLEVPAFTLFEDGRVIFSPDDGDAADGALPPLQQATLDSGQASTLVERALDEGGLREACADYAVEGVADATTTVFTVAADGVAKTVSVYGLGFSEEGPDREALATFLDLAELLTDPGAWLPDRAEVNAYEPPFYRGVFTEDDPDGPGLLPWPWDDLTPADLIPHPDASAISQADLTTDQVARVAEVPNGGAFDIAIASPDGMAAWRLALRPMLPDEVALEPTAPLETSTPGTGPATEDEDDSGY
jgi:hypothetical protein